MGLKYFVTAALIGLTIGVIKAQPGDAILFKVDDTPVYVSEFEYIYNKTNGNNADYNEASLNEYLRLYTEFKLKVKRARDLKLDTIPALIQELSGYKRQLSNNYLMDKQVTNKLLKEAYERSKYDVAISHILLRIKTGSEETEEAAALGKAREIRKKLSNGAKFEDVAKEFSEHQQSKSKGGYIGYFTVLELPDFYELESAAYDTPVGGISDILRTRLGYQIIKVIDKRPARGQMKAAHILVRLPENPSDAKITSAKVRIDSIHKALKSGSNFEKLAEKVSEDKTTGRNGGEIGTFGINKYEDSFESAAFALKADGDFSAPVRSALGWHIIKRIEKPDPQPFELAKSGLLNRIKRDSRFQIAQDAMVLRIKNEAGYSENTAALVNFRNNPGENFLRPNWTAPVTGLDQKLFSIGDENASVQDFIGFLKRNRNKRVQMGRNLSVPKVVDALFREFGNQRIIKFEESQLVNKYPDFKALMREYEEGILLFEATKILVWDKANEDSVGLKRFYESHKESYMWDLRANVQTFTLNSKDEKVLSKALKLARKKSASALLAKINKSSEILTYTEKVYEKGRVPGIENAPFKVGTVSQAKEENGVISFNKIDRIIPKSQKSLKESRGYVVADYQDFLLEKWVEKLKKEYSITVVDEVFKSLIKK